MVNHFAGPALTILVAMLDLLLIMGILQIKCSLLLFSLSHLYKKLSHLDTDKIDWLIISDRPLTKQSIILSMYTIIHHFFRETYIHEQ